MKVLWIILCTFTLSLAEGTSQKLIVYTNKNRQDAQESLLKLKVYFIENPKIRALNEAHELKVELQTLGAYTMVVVKPVISLSVKNKLLMELSPVFPGIFALEDKTQYKIDHASKVLIPVKNYEVKTLIENIGLQWIVLLLLSTVGLLLSIIRRKRLLLLDEKQKELDKNQKEIENEIRSLGKNDV